MSSTDPIPDIAPEEEHQEEPKALANSPNQVLVYIGVIIPLLMFHRLAWEAVKFMLINRVGFLQEISNKLLFVWFIPILGLISSILFPTLGGTLGWIIAISVVAGLPIFLSIPFALVFGVDSLGVPS